LVPTPSADATSTGSRIPSSEGTEEPAEEPDVGQDLGTESRAREALDVDQGAILRVDVDAGVAVGRAATHPDAHSALSIRIGNSSAWSSRVDSTGYSPDQHAVQ
jgi:hypothetical protein